MGVLLGALKHAYRVLGLEDAAGRDVVFRDLVLARIIEPVSKLDSIRVLEEAGVTPTSYQLPHRPEAPPSPARLPGPVEAPPASVAAAEQAPPGTPAASPPGTAPVQLAFDHVRDK